MVNALFRAKTRVMRKLEENGRFICSTLLCGFEVSLKLEFNSV